MIKSKVVGLNAKKIADAMMKIVVDEQTARLIAYAKEEIQYIGDAIRAGHWGNHFDRTHNLLNSLCWGVSYQGKLIDYGFYRESGDVQPRPTKRGGGSAESFLHEFSSLSEGRGAQIPVVGREIAERYVKKYGGNERSRGWRIFFAILAPYWGYWEKGFNMTIKGKSAGFYRFMVMTQFYDEIKQDLKPARTRFRVSVPKF